MSQLTHHTACLLPFVICEAPAGSKKDKGIGKLCKQGTFSQCICTHYSSACRGSSWLEKRQADRQAVQARHLLTLRLYTLFSCMQRLQLAPRKTRGSASCASKAPFPQTSTLTPPANHAQTASQPPVRAAQALKSAPWLKRVTTSTQITRMRHWSAHTTRTKTRSPMLRPAHLAPTA
jgi:hypothetical protein